jgi:hypothetical protein
LVPARRERPRRRAAEQRDELPAFHSITSSARESSVGKFAIIAYGIMITAALALPETKGRELTAEA